MISVCIATFNGDSYIKEQIDSILSQISNEDEIIVSDNGSTDNTIQIIESYSDKRIKILKFEEVSDIKISNAQRITNNFENALRYANGDYIFLSDQDDIWFPTKIEICMDYLDKFDLIVHDSIIVDKNKKILNHSYFKLTNTKKGFIPKIIKMSLHLGCCMAFNRKVLNSVLPFTKVAHDTWIYLNAELLYKTTLIPQPLSLYRRHNENNSSASEKSPLPLWYRIYYRIPLIYRVLRNFFKNKMKNFY